MLITDFWPPKLWDNKSLLFEAAQFVLLCHSSPRKLIHQPSISICTEQTSQEMARRKTNSSLKSKWAESWATSLDLKPVVLHWEWYHPLPDPPPPPPQEALGSVWRYFWLSRLSEGCYWHLLGGSRRSYSTSYNVQGTHRTPQNNKGLADPKCQWCCCWATLL